MRAYRKTTAHPFCVYFTADEAVDLINELIDANNALWNDGDGVGGTMTAVADKLNALLADPKRERA
ncbi:hypothetical protein RKD49_005396 [Streptomyces glaucescens]|jgi:hypothetical protein